MSFLIITHVKHTKQDNDFFAYAPYVREMNIWLKHVDEVEIVAPLTRNIKTDIDLKYEHSKIILSKIPEIEFTSIFGAFLILSILVSKIFIESKISVFAGRLKPSAFDAVSSF